MPALSAQPELTDEQRKRWRGHIQTGRKHAEAREWAPAVMEFEAALRLTPDDAMALNELSFVALQAGDVLKAKQAGSGALNRAVDPRLKAAALYNLGRIAEREGDAPGAKSYYLQSEALRPGQEVYQRRAGLDDPSRNPKPVLPCNQPQPLSQICACLRKTQGDWFIGEVRDPERLECEFDSTVMRPGVRLVSLANGTSERSYLIAARVGQAWAVIGELFHATFNNHHEDTLVNITFRERQLAEAHLLWVEYQVRGTQGMETEVTEDETKMVAICLLSGAKGAPRCPFNAPLTHSGTRTIYKDGKPKNYPFSSKYRVDLAPDGTATAVQVENKKDGRFDDAELGPRRLW